MNSKANNESHSGAKSEMGSERNSKSRSEMGSEMKSESRSEMKSKRNNMSRSEMKGEMQIEMESANSKPIKYISAKARPELSDYLESKGYCVVRTEPCKTVPAEISDHPDLLMCRLGISGDAPIVIGKPAELGASYPADIPYNAVCTGNFFIHNLRFTAGGLLDIVRAKAEQGEMTLVDVKQGYAKCSTVIVDERSIITYDRGIAEPCLKAGMDVLLISPGHIRLDGYNTGFVGGCSGRIKDTIIFNGDLSRHPDFEAITLFIQSKGLKCKWFPGWALEDIGSII